MAWIEFYYCTSKKALQASACALQVLHLYESMAPHAETFVLSQAV